MRVIFDISPLNACRFPDLEVFEPDLEPFALIPRWTTMMPTRLRSSATLRT